MSCGKTTLGKQLAKSLSIPFVDMDLEIEKSSNLTIPEIFSKYGETIFREMERDELRKIVASKEDMIISTGGGAPCFHSNIDIMNVAGVTVFLDVSATEITKRLLASKNLQSRPLLAQKSKEELFQYIDELMSNRIEIYRESKLTISHDAINLEMLMSRLDEMEE